MYLRVSIALLSVVAIVQCSLTNSSRNISEISLEEPPKDLSMEPSRARSLMSDLHEMADQTMVKSIITPPDSPVNSLVNALSLSKEQTEPNVSFGYLPDGSSSTQNKPRTPEAGIEKPIGDAMKLFGGLFKGSLNSMPGNIRLGDTAESFVNATKQATNMLGKIGDTTKGLLNATKTATNLLGIGGKPVSKQEEDLVYYHRMPFVANDDYLKPKYFSTDCSFRVCCEIGKWFFRPAVSAPVIKNTVRENKFIHDLQNRFTRAATFGYLYGDCSRYYCVLLELTGGPIKFLAGATEISNRILNPDLYS